MRPSVLTKQDFVRRYSAGEFGNASPTWGTLGEFLQSRYTGLVHVRNRVKGGASFYNVEPTNVTAAWDKAMSVDHTGWFISAMAPHDCGTIQGELMRDAGYLHLRYNTQKLPMRDGYKIENRCALSVVALEMLKFYLDGPSFDWMNYLFDEYPDHILEFSCFDRPWGTVPRRNTVWWEVRLY